MVDVSENREEQPELELGLSQITVEGQELVKRSVDGSAIGRHPLETLRDIRVDRRVSFLPVLVALVAAAGAGGIPFLIRESIWTWVLSGGLGLVFLICLAGARKTELVVESRHGTIRYEALESPSEAQGFAVSVKSLLN